MKSPSFYPSPRKEQQQLSSLPTWHTAFYSDHRTAFPFLLLFQTSHSVVQTEVLISAREKFWSSQQKYVTLRYLKLGGYRETFSLKFEMSTESL